VNRLKPTTESPDGIVLAREQGVDAEPRLGGQVLEAPSVELVRDKDEPLLGWQLVQRRLELVQQHPPRVRRIGPGIRRGEQILEEERRSVGLTRRFTSRAVLPLRSESVDDAISGDADQPCADLLDRAHHPHRLDQFEEHVLEDVLCVRDVADAASDEALQANRLARDDLRDVPVLFQRVEIADQGWLLPS